MSRITAGRRAPQGTRHCQALKKEMGMAEREPELTDYLGILWKRRWLVLAGPLSAAVVVFVLGIASPRTYEATATLLVTASKIPRPEGEGAANPGIAPETFESMIRNQSVAAQAVRQYGLDKEPSALAPQRFLETAVSVKTLRGTGLITVSVVLSDAKVAADVANFMAQRAVELYSNLNQADTLSAKEYIQRQRDQARVTMNEAQGRLLDFKRTIRLESLRVEQKVLLTEKQSLAERHSDYSREVKGLQMEVAGLREALTKHEQLIAVNKSIFQDGSMLAAAQERGATDLKTLSSLQLKSQEVNSVYQGVQSDLIKSETTLASLQSQHQDIEGKMKNTETHLASVETKIADAEARLEELTRNYTLAKAAYELFAKKFDEASLSIAARTTELKIFDPAIVPVSPRSRHLVRNVALGATVGVLLFMMLAFFLEYLQHSKGVQQGNKVSVG